MLAGGLDFVIDENDFSDIGFEFEGNFETRYIKPPKCKEISENNLKYYNAQKLATDIKIKKGSRYYTIINGSFIFGDFIEALIVENDYHVKEMTISTLSLSENNVDSLATLLNNNFVDKLNLVISDYFYSHERFNLTPYIFRELDKNNKFQLAACSTHCKTCIIETHCGLFITMHGSCNLRSSSNIEQFCIEESKNLYIFNDNYQKEIIEKYKTINKSVRGKKLWEAVTLK
jgi:hypothetical protein